VLVYGSYQEPVKIVHSPVVGTDEVAARSLALVLRQFFVVQSPNSGTLSYSRHDAGLKETPTVSEGVSIFAVTSEADAQPIKKNGSRSKAFIRW